MHKYLSINFTFMRKNRELHTTVLRIELKRFLFFASTTLIELFANIPEWKDNASFERTVSGSMKVSEAKLVPVHNLQEGSIVTKDLNNLLGQILKI
jgi:hypothetical protein